MIFKLEEKDFDMIDDYFRVKDNSPCQKCYSNGRCASGCYPYTMYVEAHNEFFEKVHKLKNSSSLFDEYFKQREEYLYSKNLVDIHTQRMCEIELQINELQAKIKKEFE